MERNSIEGMKCMRKVAILGTRGGGGKEQMGERKKVGVPLFLSLYATTFPRC